MRARLVRAVAGAVVAFATAVGLVWLSRVPFDYGGRGRSAVRLSWRAPAISAESCESTDGDAEDRPVHMRRPGECVQSLASFELSARVDGETALYDTVFPGGVRGDRRVYVLREIEVGPGDHSLSVRFDALTDEGTARVKEDAATAVRTRFSWEGEVTLGAGEVLLLTFAALAADSLRN